MFIATIFCAFHFKRTFKRLTTLKATWELLFQGTPEKNQQKDSVLVNCGVTFLCKACRRGLLVEALLLERKKYFAYFHTILL